MNSPKRTILLIVQFVSIIHAQELSEPSEIIGKNVIKVENYFSYAHFKTENYEANQIALINTTIRYGFSNTFEIVSTWNHTKTSESNPDGTSKSNGFSPLTIQFKKTISKQKGLIPTTHVLAGATMNFLTHNTYKNEHIQSALTLSFLYELNDTWALTSNYTNAADFKNKQFNHGYTASLNRNISENSYLFTELYGNKSPDEKTYNYWQVGFHKGFENKLEFDISGGSGINNDQKIYLSTGLAYTF